MAQVVNADTLDAGGPAAPLYLVVEKRLRYLEDALIGVAVVVCEMIRNLVDHKSRAASLHVLTLAFSGR